MLKGEGLAFEQALDHPPKFVQVLAASFRGGESTLAALEGFKVGAFAEVLAL